MKRAMKCGMSFGLIFAIVLMMGVFVSGAEGPAKALAVERIIEAPIQQVTTTLDKNGAEYTRLIIGISKTISGVSYDLGQAAMAFGPVNSQAKQLKVGDMLRAIVSERSYNGRDSFTIIKILPQKKVAKK